MVRLGWAAATLAGVWFFLTCPAGADDLTPSITIEAQTTVLISAPESSEPGVARLPRWSPDGRFLAFESGKGDAWDIWLYDVAGKSFQRVTEGRQAPILAVQKLPMTHLLSWAPDATYLTFLSTLEKNNDIFLFDFGRNSYRRIADSRSWEGEAVWSPDGTRLAYLSTEFANIDLWMKQVNKYRFTQPKRLTRGKDPEFAPSWAPDSIHLVFSAFRNKNFDIFVLNTGNKKVRQLTILPSVEIYAQWNPVNEAIALFQDDKLVTMDADGLNLQIVATGVSVHVDGLSWSPDGHLLSYVPSNGAGVAVFDTEGKTTSTLKLPDGKSFKQVSAAQFSPRGDLIAVAGILDEQPPKPVVYLISTTERFSRNRDYSTPMELPAGQSLSWSDLLGLPADPESSESGEGGQSGAVGGDF